MESNTLDNFICPICGTKLLWMPVSHIFVCEGCRETFSEDAKFYLHNYDEYIASKKSHGNAAAMREALNRVLIILRSIIGAGESDAKPIRYCERHIRAALSAPARNCDVGTAEEQVERFKEYCQSNMQYYRDMFGTHEGVGGWDCREDCPIGKMIDKNDSLCDHCQLAWAQMPYKAEEGATDAT